MDLIRRDMTEDFNSQPHKEADGYKNHSREGGWNISTHSLTRRLTGSVRCYACRYCISTHSLTRRLTDIMRTIAIINLFQLTASQGG